MNTATAPTVPTAELIHVTGAGHKIHHAFRLADERSTWIGRPNCGAERWGTYRNNSVTISPITCKNCLASRGTQNCPICKER